jgi:hypothetical protein
MFAQISGFKVMVTHFNVKGGAGFGAALNSAQR